MSPFLGAGVGFRRAHRRALLAAEGPRPALLEVFPCHFFADPEALAPLAERYPLVFHDVGCSVGGTEEDPERLGRIAALVRAARPALFTEHLALTRADGVDLGHLGPVWYTRAVLDGVCDRVRRWQDVLRVPVALENIAAPLVLAEGDYDEPGFFAELTARTGCGLLLDVTNLALNALNFGFDAPRRLAEYPLHAVWQVHLAGGHRHGEWWVDSHSAPVGAESLDLLAALRGVAPLRAIVVERDDALPSLADLVAEADAAAAVWTGGAA